MVTYLFTPRILNINFKGDKYLVWEIKKYFYPSNIPDLTYLHFQSAILLWATFNHYTYKDSEPNFRVTQILMKGVWVWIFKYKTEFVPKYSS